MFPIRYPCFSRGPLASWPQIIGRWLGHLWSTITDHLRDLVERISSVADKRFLPEEVVIHESLEEDTPTPLPSPKLIREKAPTDVEEQPEIEEKKQVPEDEKWRELFKTDDPSNDQAESMEAESAVAEVKPAAKEPDTAASQNALTDAQKKAQPTGKEAVDEDPILDEDMLLADLYFNEDTLWEDFPQDEVLAKQPDHVKQPEADKIEEEPESETRRRRNYKPLPEIPLSPHRDALKSQPLAAVDTSIQKPLAKPTPPRKPTPVPDDKGPLLIECGGKGDCQLLSILQGLEMQHHELLAQQRSKLEKYEKDKKSFPYTEHDFRSMGVAFVREQLKSDTKHGQILSGYIDSDRKEYNDDLVGRVQYEWDLARATLKTAKAEGKLKGKAYHEELKLVREKYTKEADRVEKQRIRKKEEFLNRLEHDGFACSTVHLYALSCLLGVPIHVHGDKEGKSSDPQLQKFNPAESTLAPIHLYGVDKGHYQLMLFVS